MLRGLITNIQKFSLHDGPGIRTTVFLKGCPLQCWWCHNPESQSPEPEVSVIASRCQHCGECWKACANNLEPPRCTRCGSCVTACPTGARSTVGQVMTVDEVMAVVEQDRIFY